MPKVTIALREFISQPGSGRLAAILVEVVRLA